jgi:hypothetical protein
MVSCRRTLVVAATALALVSTSLTSSAGEVAPRASASYRITNPNTNGSFAAVTSKTATFRSSDGKLGISCASGTLSGTIDSWIGSSGNLTAEGNSFGAATLTGCRGADGSPWDAYWYNNVYPSYLRATSYSGGVTSIHATATLELYNPAEFCGVRFASFDGTYANAQLSFTRADVQYDQCTTSTAPFAVSLVSTVSPAITITQQPPSFSVSGNTHADGSFASSGSLQIRDLAYGVVIADCPNASLSGTMPNADGINGPIGTVTTDSPGSCTNSDGDGVTVRALDLPWTLKTEGYIVNRHSGVSYGTASGTGDEALAVSWPGCAFRLVNDSGDDLRYWSAQNSDHSLTTGLTWQPTDITGTGCGSIDEGGVIAGTFTGTLAPATIGITAR